MQVPRRLPLVIVELPQKRVNRQLAVSTGHADIPAPRGPLGVPDRQALLRLSCSHRPRYWRISVPTGTIHLPQMPRGQFMSNAWSYYFSPLLIGTAFLAAVLSSPTPWTRQRLFDHVFHTPAERIKRFVIEPGQPNRDRPLTNSQIVIHDAVRIRRIAEVLHATQEVSPNHPRARWTARIRMVTDDGTYCFGVEATVPGDPNGTLVNMSSNPNGDGWNLGSVRANGLEKILGEAANTGLPADSAVPPRDRSEQ